MKYKILLAAISTLLVLFAGCIDNKETAVITPESTKIVSNATQQTSDTRFEEISNNLSILEEKIILLQKENSNLHQTLARVGIMSRSNKTLIPKVPFELKIYPAEWRVPLTYTFQDNGEVRLRDESDAGGSGERARYTLDISNNTIRIQSKKYNFYGIVLYDEYATAIYENGQIEWAMKYKIVQSVYNPVTQKNELK